MRKSLLPEITLIAVAFIWGVNIPFMKNGLDRMEWFAFNAVRLVVSALVLGTIAIIELRQGHRPTKDLRWYHVVVFAGFVSFAYQFLFLMGVTRTTSGNTGLIISTIPVWTAICSRLWLKDRMSAVAKSGLVIAFIGTVIVAVQKVDFSALNRELTGNLFILAAAISWAAGTVYSRPLLSQISSTQLSACAALMALPFHLFIARTTLAGALPALNDSVVWGSILYSGVFSTGLALPMWNYGVRTAGPAQAAAFQNLVPVIAIMTAWLTRAEPITVAQFLGGTLIIGGLVLMRRGR